MASKTLAVAYRPQTWSEVEGQGSTKVILQQQLDSGEVRNSYLFCGASGCGKTTCARIFANEVNKGQGTPIEMDAASHSSVDDVREIIKMAQTRSMDSEYKCFIIDECFPGNTLVKTPTSEKRISDIVSGDIVESMSGSKVVTHVFKNRVLTDRLCCVTVNNRKIITTVEHLFFTNHGWIMASQLQRGDIVYGSEDLQELWERVCKGTGQRREVLLKQLCNQVSLSKHDRGAKAESAERRESVSYMSTEICSEEDLISKNLFSRVQESAYYEVEQTVDEFRIWDGTSETVIRKNVKEQSNEGCSKHTEDAGHEREEWDTSSMAYSAGWKREVYDSTDRLVESIRTWLGVGISDKHKESGLARDEITLVLQSRPWLFREETGDRGRWSRPQVEKFIIEGCKENRSPRNARVESVEIYQRGYNDELFRGSFSDSELSGKYVTMYDLEVEDDHSYFVENCLVHNCHSISNTGWQAMLKLIEEPPAKSIFIFCTTNPEKIPKTILNRVQRYDFKRIPYENIVRRMQVIIQNENDKSDEIQYTPEALDYIARQSKGGMRDALALLDKCLAYSLDLTLDNVLTALELSDTDTFINLTEAVLEQDRQTVIDIIERVYADGEDMKQFIKQYMNFILDVTKWYICEDFKYTQLAETKEMKDWLSKHDDLDTLLDLLDTVISIDADIKFSSSAKEYIEVQLITF